MRFLLVIMMLNQPVQTQTFPSMKQCLYTQNVVVYTAQQQAIAKGQTYDDANRTYCLDLKTGSKDF